MNRRTLLQKAAAAVGLSAVAPELIVVTEAQLQVKDDAGKWHDVEQFTTLQSVVESGVMPKQEGCTCAVCGEYDSGGPYLNSLTQVFNICGNCADSEWNDDVNT